MAQIVPAHLAVKAMRDNGYKNAAYALAELIDNSIQHGANFVELICHENQHHGGANTVYRVDKIAVIDNGHGMDKDTLRLALQFGNGTHLDPENQNGISRFGMGLPSSSISQAKRVDVWSWQSGIENALHSYLDLDEIVNQEMTEVPEPTFLKVEDIWKEASQTCATSTSGTIVVWSKVDRCFWKTGRAIINNSEFVIGRMYRNFINSGSAKIRLFSFRDNNVKNYVLDKEAMPNDPIYLMSETSCPEPFDKTPMFDKWGGENYISYMPIHFRGQQHEVKVKFSTAKLEARKLGGQHSVGKHARNNVGVSIVRAGRELELDTSWTIQYDPVERWWGVEVEFPPALDELFGVTNNKQHAHNFNELSNIEIAEDITIHEYYEQLVDSSESADFLLNLSKHINSRIKSLRNLIKDQMKNSKKAESKHIDSEDAFKSEKSATEATNRRIVEQGIKGRSDLDENKTEEERKKELEEEMLNQGLEEQNALDLSGTVIDAGLKYVFLESSFDSTSFFSVKPKAGSIIITVNTDHPAYRRLVEVLEEGDEDESLDSVKQRLKNASEGLKLLLMAWARYEDEQPDGPPRKKAQQVRQDWGTVAAAFLSDDE